MELAELPELGVLPERVIDVHADGDQAARAVEEAEVDDVVAEELAGGVAEEVPLVDALDEHAEPVDMLHAHA